MEKPVSETIDKANAETINIRVSEKYLLTVHEAAAYFHIGENKLRDLINSNTRARYLLWNGNRALIKRKLFEEYIDGIDVI